MAALYTNYYIKKVKQALSIYPYFKMNTDLVKNIIIRELQKKRNIWADLSVVIDICNNELNLGVSKEFFLGNPDFRIYRTGNPILVYITLPEIGRNVPKRENGTLRDFGNF